jgi:transposase
MANIGIDLHKAHSQICILDDQGVVVLEQRIATRRDRFHALFANRPRAKIVLESSTDSEWVARFLEQLGHEVVVVDPGFALTYATRNPKVKTDARDARALADACRLGNYRPAHRASDSARMDRARLQARVVLVRSRTALISQVRALLRREGYQLPTCASSSVPRRVRELPLGETMRDVLRPLVDALYSLNDQIDACDRAVAQATEGNGPAKLLMSAPSVGPVTALAFVSVVDRIERFENAHRLQAYLGLVPSERSSGEKRRRGGITKRGNTMLRWLLVETGTRLLMGQGGEEAERLRLLGQAIASRKGKQVAAVALARRLTGVLYALWRDGTNYDPGQVGKRMQLPAAA